ncbi:reticulon-4-interacting protein 1 homolog, mitochondrial [Larimichthys crocea]|uniref:reticulon-4-interacting protein 1 homolog, mitochondrial n=1 Tax=Larimichthys crocea TaxID=215358 RepID=UPI0009010970|nr:reticulon-4-interacting protein 1 homolog, mitochondrial [Larimichthys crocea]XP_019132904.1 reticulon-4-interacting protein 1 homolog, mitochondrial [Larimichthys crocea]XP_027139714.1 reticulon-4-interacting protein 1 homolog, mitochondrial [Larimichthys crocea]
MASARLLCLSYARAASSSKALGRAGWRNVCTSPSRLQGCMSAWVIDQYGTNGVLKYTEEISIPTVSSPQEVMIKVHAASLNPLDVSMRGGYGAKLLKLRRDPLSVMDSDSEFPLILGRDVSGVVVDCGSEVTHFAPGDEVWAAVPPWKQGSLAEFVTLTEYEVSHKPKLLSHTEAASIPYVANTALSALVNAGGLCRDSASNKRVLITGGSGGVGTFTIQLLKAWGANVTVTCSQNAEGLVRGLGADEVVDYTAGDAAEQLEMMEKFDVILDSVGGETEQWVMGKLKPWSGAKYVTLVTPLLHNTDSMGLLDGAFRAVFTLNSKVTQNMISSGIFYRWGFYAPDGPALDEVSKLVDEGKILPVVEAQFPFTQVPQAFQKLEEGHARGKTVVRVAEEDDRQAEELVQNSRTETAESEQEVPKTAKQH